MNPKETLMLRKAIFIAALSIFLASCGINKNYRNYEASPSGDEKVVIGKVDVVYNGESYNTELCEFCIGEVCHEPLKDGFVYMPLIREGADQMSLSCHYLGGQGDFTHVFNIDHFKVQSGVTYFGNLLFAVDEVTSDMVTSDMGLPQPRYRRTYKDLYYSGIPLVGQEFSGNSGLVVGIGFLVVDAAIFYPLGYLLRSEVTHPHYLLSATVAVRDDESSVLEAFAVTTGKEGTQVERNIIVVRAPAVVGKTLRVVIGKVEVVYNGEPHKTRGCRFCIGTACSNLYAGGYVFVSLGQDNSAGMSLSCFYRGGQGESIHVFEVEPLEVKPGVTYIGNFLFTVDEVSPGKVLPQESGSIRSASYIPQIGYNLSAAVSVQDNDMAPALDTYRLRVDDENIQAEKSLIKVKAPLN